MPADRAGQSWTTSYDGSMAILSFYRPPYNMMTFGAMEELEAQLLEISAKEDVSVIVIIGAVDGYFVAHADVEELVKLGNGATLSGDPRVWFRTLRLIEEIPQPVVAAINGQAHGGGLELALAATIRIASDAAHFALPECRIGIIPGAGGTQRLPQIVGIGRATEIVLSGRTVSPPEALDIGLVTAVFASAEFAESVAEWCAALTRSPAQALAAAKKALLGVRPTHDDGFRREAELFVSLQKSDEAIERERELLHRYHNGHPPLIAEDEIT